MELLDADRRLSWQRLTTIGVGAVISTVLIVTGFISDDVWGTFNGATFVAFVGSEAVRHYSRNRFVNQQPIDPGAP